MLNLELAKYHYIAVTDKNNHPSNPQQRFNFIPHNTDQVKSICKFHGAKDPEHLDHLITKETERRKTLPRYDVNSEQSKLAHVYETFITRVLGSVEPFSTDFSSTISEIEDWSVLRKKFESEILIDRWCWNYMTFVFDLQAQVVKIKTASNVDGLERVHYDVNVLKTEMPMTEKALGFYVRLLDKRVDVAAEAQYEENLRMKRLKAIQDLRKDKIDKLRYAL
ncbi:hypothetical protein P10VF_030 [Rhizobium phage vB_RleM_P10VF]|uniref:Uncharacterized protein n=1 Tax=Rhizobium phage vB_RleM_P10VF TaxID=1527770 RepID=A0A076YIL5_9CAUD|nr:hypothetical protein P10VF_030 [Rhizobium phage vB_RleM_P10VF]AIK68243.1 hypothetical protein P10VF_030 [Rhizobium phage vB_RleM_P10VF]